MSLAFVRDIKARAKVELREHVTEQDAKDVVDMMQEVSRDASLPGLSSPVFWVVADN